MKLFVLLVKKLKSARDVSLVYSYYLPKIMLITSLASVISTSPLPSTSAENSLAIS